MEAAAKAAAVSPAKSEPYRLLNLIIFFILELILRLVQYLGLWGSGKTQASTWSCLPDAPSTRGQRCHPRPARRTVE